ncbi:hypothetical protein J1614_008093, partial [Plenodomus biglobosus]
CCEMWITITAGWLTIYKTPWLATKKRVYRPQHSNMSNSTGSDMIDIKNDVAALQARQKVDATVLPLLVPGLLVFQLDRMNLASALTDGFAQEIDVNQDTINLGNQLMFLDIVVLEIPSNIILQRKWISAQVFVFGLVATFQVFMRDKTGFLVAWTLLSLCEAGYIPGGIYTLSTWYTKRELAKRVAVFFFGMFGGNAISPLLASGILKLRGHEGMKGWQWLFLLEGIFTMLVSITLLFLLPGTPNQPRPLLSPGLIRFKEPDDSEHKTGTQSLHMPLSLVWKTVTHYRCWPSFISWVGTCTLHPTIQLRNILQPRAHLTYTSLQDSKILPETSEMAIIFAVNREPETFERWNGGGIPTRALFHDEALAIDIVFRTYSLEQHSFLILISAILQPILSMPLYYEKPATRSGFRLKKLSTRSQLLPRALILCATLLAVYTLTSSLTPQPPPQPKSPNIPNILHTLFAAIKLPLTSRTYTDAAGKTFEIHRDGPWWTVPLQKDILIVDIDTRVPNQTNELWSEGPLGRDALGGGTRKGRWRNAECEPDETFFVRARAMEGWHSTWVKPRVFLELLPRCKFVVFLYGDANFAHLDVPLVWMFNRWAITPRTCIAMPSDVGQDLGDDSRGNLEQNTGVVVLQNMPYTYIILEAWRDCPTEKRYPDWAHEQTAWSEYIRYDFNPNGTQIVYIPGDDAMGFPGQRDNSWI